MREEAAARQRRTHTLGYPHAADAGYDVSAANALLEHAELLQIQYGAIILSFMGAVHWGFEVRRPCPRSFLLPRGPAQPADSLLSLGLSPRRSQWAKYGGVKGNRRYLLGVVPVLAGWGSLLIPGQMALVTQWGAFFAQWYMDQKATTMGWVPKWYATVRLSPLSSSPVSFPRDLRSPHPVPVPTQSHAPAPSPLHTPRPAAPRTQAPH